MGGEPHDGVGTENSPSQAGGGIVLSHVDPVRFDIESQVGPVVQDEGHPVIGADAPGDVGPLDDPSGLEFLVAQLDDVHPTCDTAVEELGQVGPVSGAEIEVPTREGRS